MKIISILGARPQFVKLAPIARAFKKYENKVTHLVVHTGQHYDKNMSAVFFDELDLTPPHYNLGVGSGTHAEQTARALEKIEHILRDERPDHIIVYGDTNATLSGVLAASKLGMPISHIEAGLRSFNRRMPEEINRIIADRLSTYLFCPNDSGVKNLLDEGMVEGVLNVGDVMVDQIHHLKANKNIEYSYEKPYVFMTLHRQETSDAVDALEQIMSKINNISDEMLIIFPVHPRMKNIIKSLPIKYGMHFKMVAPMGYIETIKHIKNARCIITDSGGVQKEAYVLKTPCITVRTETEWTETLKNNWNMLVGFNPNKLQEAFEQALHFDRKTEHFQVYGDGFASIKIVNKILKI